MKRRDFLKAVAGGGIAASVVNLAVDMDEIVQKLWEGTEASECTERSRTDIPDNGQPNLKVHEYGRSQCRTTHKRQDC